MILHWEQLLRLCPIKVVAIFIALCLCLPAFSGVISVASDLQVVSTKYFDIIFPSESAFSAKILVEEADSLYLKACKELGSTPYFRVPVVITPSYDNLNAYFSIVPYNRIVLYDVLPATSDSSSLAVFSETLKSVFYHELVHCVSLNMKSSFFQFTGNVFGDWVNPSLLNLNTLFIEGAAVALESQDGEGRLNNGFSLHLLRQAKLEDKFPSWLDACGARDIYPSGTVPYIFGGAFTEWLLATYGKEKYATFLYETAKIHFFKMTAGIFKKVYGFSLKTAWNSFQEQLYVPDIPSNPEDDFSSAYSFDSTIEKKGFYRSLSSCSTGFAWLDLYTSSVKFLAKGQKGSKTLLEYDGLYKVSLDKDGKWLVGSRTKNGIVENQVFVYNIETEKKAFLPDSGLRDGIIFSFNEKKQYCAAILSEGQKSSIVLYEILKDEKNNFSIDSNVAYNFSLPDGFPVYSLMDTGDGRIAFLGGGKADSLYIFDPMSKKCQVCYLGNNLKDICDMENFTLQEIVSLGIENNELLIGFSWATKNTLPRLGIISIPLRIKSLGRGSNEVEIDFSSKEIDSSKTIFSEDIIIESNNKDFNFAQVFLAENDVSGGVYSPVPVFKDSLLWQGELRYSAHFFEEDRMMCLDVSKIDFAKHLVPIEKFNLENKKDKITQQSFLDNEIDFETKKYNPLKYVFPGTILPLGSVSYYDPKLNNNFLFPLGITWISTDPTETGIFSLTGSYDFFLNNWGFTGGVTTENFSVNGSVIFEKNEFAFSSAELNYSANFEIGSVFNIGLYDSLIWAGGYDLISSDYNVDSNIATETEEVEKEYINSALNTATIRFSTVRSGGKGYYNLKGFALNFHLSTLYSDIIDGWYNNFGVSYIQLIPGYVPIEASVSIFPSNTSALDFETCAYLYTLEIQKGIPILQLYMNRLSFIVGYEGNWDRNNSSWDIIRLWDVLQEIPQLDFNDNLFIRLESITSLNATIMTGSSLNLYADFILRFRHAETLPKYDFRMGMGLSL